MGNRIRATRSGITTKCIYAAAGNLLAEANNSNQITRYYIYSHGLLGFVDAQTNQLYTYHFDGTGHTVATTNPNRQIVNSYAYDPYGKLMAQTESIAQPFKYAGQFGVHAEENNLYYMCARYYDADIGRFISEDPIGFEGGLNLYAYAGGNPIMAVDPSGLLTLDEANQHWLNGGGAPLTVDINTLDLSNVTQLPPNGQVKFIGRNFSSVNDALVYGTLTLFPGPNNTVVGGYDRYDFEIKPWSTQTFVRNIETIIGRAYAGPGTAFVINLIGTANLGSKGKRGN